ncbi:MAG: flippase [Melioribacteraceae bacterium]|nr:flippase [Melioribacteraceae bacterium]
MSEYSKIGKNSIYSFLSIFFRVFSNIIIFWLIARYYSADVFGQFTTAQTFASVFILLADFGMDILLTTELPRRIEKSSQIFSEIFSAKLIFASFAFLLMLSLSILNQFSEATSLLLLMFSFFVLFSTITNFFFAFYKGNEKLGYEARVSFINNFGSLIAVLILILLKQNILLIAGAYVAVRLIGLLLAFYYVKKINSSISLKFTFPIQKNVIKKIIVLGMFMLFGNLFFQLDTILLAFWRDEKSVGTYQAVFRLIMVLLIIPDVFINSLMPVLSRLRNEDKEKWEKLSFIFNKILVTIIIPASIVMFVYPDEILGLAYGADKYNEAIPIFRIFSFIMLIRFFTEAYGLMLITADKQKVRMTIVILGTALNFVVNFFMIPRYDALGAGITSLITNFVVGFLYYYTARNLKGNWIAGFAISKLILLIIAFALIVYIAGLLSAWYLSFAAALIYYYYAFRFIFSKSEQEQFMEVINNNRLSFMKRS